MLIEEKQKYAYSKKSEVNKNRTQKCACPKAVRCLPEQKSKFTNKRNTIKNQPKNMLLNVMQTKINYLCP